MDRRPNILLFTIDTLRADHTSTYGYARETTPTLTRLASHATRFERAYSTSSWTVPAIASILTGLTPSAHGVQHGFWLDHETVVGQETLPTQLPTIATQLHDAGYRTIGVVANVHLDPMLGFGRGFDSYTALDFTATTTEVNAAVTRELDALHGSEPYFLWVHLIEPHAPYQPRRPIFDTWRPAGSPEYTAIDSYMLEEFLDVLMTHENIPRADGLAYVTAAYDSEIFTADAYLGTLLDRIDDGHLAIVVSADHGEELRDHARYGHGHTGFEEVTRVPLVIAQPGRSEARVVRTPVSLVDVLPTLLEIAGAPPIEATDGRSLVRATLGDALEERDVVIETGRGHEVVQAIVRGDDKYGRVVAPFTFEVLFDLRLDPHETHDRLREAPDVAASLRERLDRYLAVAAARRPPMTVAPIEIRDEVRAQLEALGYAPTRE